MRKVILLLLVLVVLPGATVAQEPPARDVELATVIGVIDGDSIEVDIEGRLYRVRYIGINAPGGE